jgi:hypothetical protein
MLPLAMALFLLLSAPAAVNADVAPVKLQLGGVGATSWAINNIKPGDSGSQTVALSNTGSRDGQVTIWLSEVVNGEGGNPESETGDTAEPGELGRYLKLGISISGLSTNFNLPATVNSFPQSADSLSYIRLNRLSAGQTVNLIWTWELPPETGNDVQGDTLSFAINYLLEELSSPPGESDTGGGTSPDTGNTGIESNRLLEVVTPDGAISLMVTRSGVIRESQMLALMDNKLTLRFTSNTQVSFSDGGAPDYLDVKMVEQVPAVPNNVQRVSPAYELSGFSANGVARPVQFDQPVMLVINYDLASLPDNTRAVFLAYYDEKLGWTQLEPPQGFVAGVGEVAARVNHFSLFAVLAELAPHTSVPAPVTPNPEPLTPPTMSAPAPAAARFELHALSISPERAKPGETVNISAWLKNTGGLAGEHILHLLVTDLWQKSEVISLLPGENRKISFSITPNQPGTYQVKIDDLSGILLVEAPLPVGVPTHESARWLLLLLLAVPVIAVLILLKVKRPTTCRNS